MSLAKTVVILLQSEQVNRINYKGRKPDVIAQHQPLQPLRATSSGVITYRKYRCSCFSMHIKHLDFYDMIDQVLLSRYMT